MSAEVGNIVDGKVSGLTNFGAFVKLPTGEVGLVHISEVAEEYIKDIKSHLIEDQDVKVKIISVEKTGKIGLSIKKAITESAPKVNTVISKAKDFTPNNKFEKKGSFEKRNNFDKKNNFEKRPSDLPLSFEDRLSKFMKDSDEKMTDLKRNFESKRGSGSYRRY